MAEVLAIVGTLLAFEVIFLIILTVWWLLFPAAVGRARLRLERTPWRCFLLGCVTTVMLLPSIVILIILPLEMTRLVGCLLLFVLLAFASLGAAGLATKMGGQSILSINRNRLPFSVRGWVAVVFELMAGFWLGGMIWVILLSPISILLTLPFDLTWLVGLSLFFIALALGVMVAAGLAVKRGGNFVPHAAFIRGAVTLELVVAFPLLGWFIVTPLLFVTVLGATVFALLHWTPTGAASVIGNRAS